MKKQISISDRVKIINCAIQFDIVKASNYYNISQDLISKWVNDKENIFRKERQRIERQKEYAKNYYHSKDTKPKQKAKTKEYYLRHPFYKLRQSLKRNLRAKEYGYTIPSMLSLLFIAKRQKLKCAISGQILTRENMSIDHIIPLCKGGTNDISNLQILTIEINIMKNSHSTEEFIRLCKLVALNNTKE
jgi:5-methylcytosine-specific restriction endonuclease McrA